MSGDGSIIVTNPSDDDTSTESGLSVRNRSQSSGSTRLSIEISSRTDSTDRLLSVTNPSASDGDNVGDEYGIARMPRRNTGTGPDDVYKLVLIGMRGAGKSSVGNTIVGRNVFPTAQGREPCTLQCQSGTCLLYSNSFKVIDTPGMSLEDTDNEVKRILSKCMEMSVHGPHAILWVIDPSVDNGQVVYDRYRMIKTFLGIDVRKYIMVAFTGEDRLRAHGLDVATMLERQRPRNAEVENSPIRKILEDVSFRYVKFNNLGTEDQKRNEVTYFREQLGELIRRNKPHTCFPWHGFRQTENDAMRKAIVDEVITGRARNKEEARQNIERNLAVDQTSDSELRARAIGETVGGASASVASFFGYRSQVEADNVSEIAGTSTGSAAYAGTLGADQDYGLGYLGRAIFTATNTVAVAGNVSMTGARAVLAGEGVLRYPAAVAVGFTGGATTLVATMIPSRRADPNQRRYVGGDRNGGGNRST